MTGFPFMVIDTLRFTANDKDFSLALEMTIRESDVSWSLSHKSLEIANPQSPIPNP